MTDEERLQTVDLVGNTSPESEVLWALNYLLQQPVEDDLPFLA